jgi:spindle assembly abnormal protein 6
VLRVQVTSETDPFFFHHMEVSEDEFQSLKVEQSILVDFAQFPDKFIELLEECIASRGEENPRVLAVLRVGADGEPDQNSSLGVVETNKFKHLSHISLAFKPGDDASIKQYLAARLMDVKGERDGFAASHRDAAASHAAALRDLELAAAETQSQREHAEHVEAAAQARLDELAANLKMKAMEELENTKTRMEGERSAAETGMRGTIESLTSRNAELDARARELMEAKYKLDSKYSDASSRLTAAEGELATAREELKSLRKANKDLDKGLNEREKSTAQNGMRVEWLESQLKDKEELCKVLKGRLESAESHKASQESALEDARAAAVRAEDRVSASAGEIRKGNQIIERLQAELRSAKAKAKLKAAVIAQQETLLSERQGALDKAARAQAEATREADAAREDARALERRVEDQKKKLEESQALLTSNQQMIQWLNGQVNEAQLGRLGSSSRYSFRPSVPLPVPSVSAAGAKADAVPANA